MSESAVSLRCLVRRRPGHRSAAQKTRPPPRQPLSRSSAVPMLPEGRTQPAGRPDRRYDFPAVGGASRRQERRLGADSQGDSRTAAKTLLFDVYKATGAVRDGTPKDCCGGGPLHTTYGGVAAALGWARLRRARAGPMGRGSRVPEGGRGPGSQCARRLPGGPSQARPAGATPVSSPPSDANAPASAARKASAAAADRYQQRPDTQPGKGSRSQH